MGTFSPYYKLNVMIKKGGVWQLPREGDLRERGIWKIWGQVNGPLLKKGGDNYEIPTCINNFRTDWVSCKII